MSYNNYLDDDTGIASEVNLLLLKYAQGSQTCSATLLTTKSDHDSILIFVNFQLGPESLGRQGSGGVPQPLVAQSALAGVRGRSPREIMGNLKVSNFEINLQKCNFG